MTDTLSLTPHRPADPALRARVERFLFAAKADATYRAYTTAWREFVAFCQANGYNSLPASPDAVVDFLTRLAEAGQKVSTLQLKLAAISFTHEAARVSNPVKTPVVRTTMAGIRRTLGAYQHGKAPLLLSQLHTLVTHLGSDLRGARDKALILVGWAGAFRRSELVALQVSDLRFDDGCLRVLVRRSKTDQEGVGVVKAIPATGDSDLCPVAALRAWLDVADIRSGPVFRSIDRWGHVHGGLTVQEVARIVKRMAERAGLDPRQFAGHSLRAGFVTQAATNGAAEWQIQEVTGHRSTQVLRRYIRAAGSAQMDAIRTAFKRSR